MKWNYKGLVDWVNGEFERLEITEYEAIKAERTYFTGYQYESGACFMHIYFKRKGYNASTLYANNYFMSFYPLKELKTYVNKGGYEMYLKFKTRSAGMFMHELEIELRKKL